MINNNASAIAKAYFGAWKSNNFNTLRFLSNYQVTFSGPLGYASNAEECIKGLRKMADIMKDAAVHKIFVNNCDVLTWYDLITKDDKRLPVANWIHVENNKIARIQVAFDPRLLIMHKAF